MANAAAALGGWRDIDSAGQSERLLEFLDHLAAVPAVLAAKRRSYELLAASPGDRLLDAGCGTGTDVAALSEIVAPRGAVVGVDASAAAISVARSRSGAHFEVADVAALPFGDDAFDGARADRTLLHVRQPESAVAELVRVTRPGGRVVISEAAFTEPRRRGRPRQQRYDGPRILAFVPFLLAQAGAEGITVDRSETVADLNADLREFLGAGDGPITLRIVHVLGTVAR